MPRFLRLIPAFGALLLFSFTLGCGNKTNVVKGHVLFEDGKAATELKGYAITLQSAEHKDNANGLIEADGSFTVGTYKNGDGALPGKHLVAITPPLPEVDRPATPAVIPARYGSFETSKLEIIIKSGVNEPKITVERKR